MLALTMGSYFNSGSETCWNKETEMECVCARRSRGARFDDEFRQFVPIFELFATYLHGKFGLIFFVADGRQLGNL